MLNTYRCIGGTWRGPAQDQEVKAEDQDEFEDIVFPTKVWLKFIHRQSVTYHKTGKL